MRGMETRVIFKSLILGFLLTRTLCLGIWWHSTHHVSNVRLFNSCLSPIMFLYTLVCSLLLCATGYQITVQTSLAEKMLTFEYLVFNVIQLFMYCWYANEVFYTSSCLMEGPYESIWWTRSIKLQKNIIILTEQFRTLIIFTVGPFTNLTVATFINILKGAYSYYTFVSQSQNM